MVGIFDYGIALCVYPECQASFALYLAGSSFCDVRMDGLDSWVFGIRQVFCQNRFELRNNRNRNCCFIWLNFTCWVIMVGGIINATLEEMCFGEVKPKYDPIENFGKMLTIAF